MSRARSLANLANSGVFSADASTSRVGINSSAPEKTLDVVGDGRVSGTLSIGGTINYEDVTSIDSVGVVTAREGVHIVSAGASIYSPANNELALYTNSSEKVRINSSGSVGIGTDDPLRQLEVFSTGHATAAIKGDTQSSLFFVDSDDSNIGQISYIHADNDMYFRVNDEERLRITSAGKVGIGLTDPDTLLHLASTNTGAGPGNAIRLTDNDTAVTVDQVCGRIEFETKDTGNPGVNCQIDSIYTGSGGGSALQMRTGFAGSLVDALRIDDSGNIGIGTDNPEEILHILGSTETIESRDGVTLQHSTAAPAANNGLPLVWSGYVGSGSGLQNYGLASICGRKENSNADDGAAYLQFGTGSVAGAITERLRITSDGSVGIGTNNPGAALHVLSTAYPTATIQRDHDVNYPRLRIVNTANDGADLDGIGSGTGGFRISCVAAGVSTERLRITSEGKILIGIQNPRAGVFNTNLITPQFQMESAGQVDHNRMMTLVSNPGAQSGYTPTFIFGKSRGSTAGSFTGVANNDSLGQISFQGADGSELVEAARISAAVAGVTGTNDMPGRLVFSTTADGESGPTERMRIYADGGVSFKQYAEFANQADDGFSGYVGSAGIIASGGSGNDLAVRSGQHLVFTTGGSTEKMRLNSTGNLDVGANGGSSSGTGLYMQPNGQAYLFTASSLDALNIYLGGSRNAWINSSGSATFTGALSKGSGSFKISHPLPAKTKTHHLVHSFIEGPQADLIYRGYVDLVDGQATVNVDTASRMTEGTFEVLCSNVSCFTSNESDWTAVKGSVTGNVLTITAQDATATSKVSWMVVGERKDQHMLDTEWTDDAGRVITEPEKVVEATEESETEAG